MRTKATIVALGVALAATAGCVDITNPIEETGTEAPAWVAFEAPRAVNGPHGSWLPVRYGGLSVRPEKDVNITLAFDGSAVHGEDYVVVQDSGSTTAAAGFSASGGTVLFEYDPLQETTLDTMWIYVPTTATVGATAEIAMTSAQTVDGDPITVGYLEQWEEYEVTIVRAPAEIATGTYTGTVSGADIGGGPFTATVAVTAPAGGITVDGSSYDYLLSDFSLGMFGVPLAMPFNVFVDGSMDFAGQEQGLYSCSGLPITATISGAQYDFDTESFGFSVEWTSCGIEGMTYTYSDLTLQP